MKINVFLVFRFEGTTKSFLIKRTETNNNGPHKNKYYLFSDAYQALSVRALIDYYTQHKLSDEIQVRLKKPVIA